MRLATLAPALFVFLWATGFIGARYAMPHAEPFFFLAVRFVIATLLIAAMLPFVASRRRWSTGAAIHSVVAGICLHGLYLGGVFWAIDHGMPAGLSALLVGLHPLITALLAGMFLGEAVGFRHWIGLFIGFAGVALVLSPDLGTFAEGVTGATLAASLISVAGLSIGSLWQKRFVQDADLLKGTIFQYVGAWIVTACLSAAFETQGYEIHPELVFAMAWLVLVLSLGAILLLMYLIRNGAAARVASLFYLVPATTALQAWILFGEELSLIQIAGMIIAAGGVALALVQPVALARASR